MIHFKKPKEEVLRQIKVNAGAAISYSLQNNLGASMNINLNTNSIAYAIEQAISEAVAEGFRTMLEAQYTEDDFERDMTLKT